ncbi:Holliday junction resolvase RuvX [Campylobacter vicugnae]|uniref:Holliday junction resolvase RuvX n=1 Tax=Campylobacter vicugnae TaxID=1660076 RepID=UPI00254C642D|nr:Holliday junction resolvase RuvX [Campylobacter ovis]MDL0104831.1 Holliday junction resolvase RuvX [Campylobacter ovis]MDL0105991.1 Holliday junction resolvase RuvX [Campylobacter ovis]
MIVAIDIGLKRIGMAVSPDGKIALPIAPILRKNRNQAAKDVSNALKDREAKILVVGLPKGGSSEAEMERRIKHFISLLDFNSQICYENEAYSSLEASDLIDDKRDGKLDSVAAMIILERFLKR